MSAVNPMLACSGVRSSWLTVRRKCVLAALASSAAARAACAARAAVRSAISAAGRVRQVVERRHLVAGPRARREVEHAERAERVAAVAEDGRGHAGAHAHEAHRGERAVERGRRRVGHHHRRRQRAGVARRLPRGQGARAPRLVAAHHVLAEAGRRAHLARLGDGRRQAHVCGDHVALGVHQREHRHGRVERAGGHPHPAVEGRVGRGAPADAEESRRAHGREPGRVDERRVPHRRVAGVERRGGRWALRRGEVRHAPQATAPRSARRPGLPSAAECW
jgi:hypothetical protein